MQQHYLLGLCLWLLPVSVWAQPGDEAAQEGSRVEVNTDGGLEIETADGQFAFELGGRLMIDTAHHREGLNPLGDGTELRRARIEMEGRLFRNWEFEFDVDAAASVADVKDALIRYNFLREEKEASEEAPLFRSMNLSVGQFKEPMSIEELTSSKYITFMERSLINDAFTPGRSMGAGFWALHPKFTLAGGIFGQNFVEDVLDEGDEGWALTGRATTAPIRSDRRLLHLALSGSVRRTNEQMNTVIRTRPESHIVRLRYADTGFVDDVEKLTKIHVEGVGIAGPFSVQGEFVTTGVDRMEGQESLSFRGGYVLASYFLTGESRPYTDEADFEKVQPTSPRGAVQLAVRYSAIDLTDKDILGGVEKNVTIGINWFINKNVRLQGNFLFIDADENADSAGKAVGGDRPKIFQARFQLFF